MTKEETKRIKARYTGRTAGREAKKVGKRWKTTTFKHGLPTKIEFVPHCYWVVIQFDSNTSEIISRNEYTRLMTTNYTYGTRRRKNETYAGVR